VSERGFHQKQYPFANFQKYSPNANMANDSANTDSVFLIPQIITMCINTFR